MSTLKDSWNCRDFFRLRYPNLSLNTKFLIKSDVPSV